MRLDKYLTSVTDLSRAESKRILKSSVVTVDGVRVTDPKTHIAEQAEVAIDGDLLRTATARYFMLHKPLGYVSATKDREHLTVLELLDEDNLDQLHIAGRLDIDTTGLVLLTDDGQWSHRVTSPKRDCYKTYLLETADPITDEAVEKIEQGIHLDNEKRPTKPAAMELVDVQTARLTISEGKYHQVKRMLAAVGNKVEMLHRERIGDIVLDEDLLPGEYRELTETEVASI
ncbi:16S rRNA pseudouridine(516) synthase RsuA [Oceanicoccus sagamiensis]|uniref:Pseudouridine synthase n=1 Tax=Oceanicoccus sagamiensis TaxID=716816 RepID=A0A1X9NFH6_9GAMM|nr:16S rRNA pseudouridine(516) synthase RsuA [Oceanicoccus sagamiensis]ARN74625.1 16S rRNA pseudouridine(516) synthase [Oceanicoccus sagamiensis]